MQRKIIQLVSALDRALKTLHPQAHPKPQKRYPAEGVADTLLQQGEEQRQKSCYQMRINHTGEVCAQALYDGHFWVQGRDQEEQRRWLHEARDEEIEHLIWCQRRLNEIGGSPSRLNPIFYVASYMMARTLSYINPAWNMQFIAETEKQVAAHLASQQEELSFDARSLAIIEQMKADEAQHQKTAESFEAKRLPQPASILMQKLAASMKLLVRYF